MSSELGTRVQGYRQRRSPLIRGLYTGASGMVVQMHRLDAISNNLANVDLNGYKRDTAIRPRVKNGNADRPDVDIIVITNHDLSDEPADVLALLYSTRKKKYSTIRLQARSVGIETANADMDVVPISARPFVWDDALWVIADGPNDSKDNYVHIYTWRKSD